MADEENEDEEAAAAAAAKKKKKVMIGAFLASAAVYKFVLSGGGEVPPDALASVDGVVAEEQVAEGDIIPIPEMTLNLADEDELRFARIGLAVVLLEGEDPVVAGTKMPLVQDVVVDVVGEMTFAELRAPGAKEALKEKVSELSREAFDGETVSRVLFTSFVMQ